MNCVLRPFDKKTAAVLWTAAGYSQYQLAGKDGHFPGLRVARNILHIPQLVNAFLGDKHRHFGGLSPYWPAAYPGPCLPTIGQKGYSV